MFKHRHERYCSCQFWVTFWDEEWILAVGCLIFFPIYLEKKNQKMWPTDIPDTPKTPCAQAYSVFSLDYLSRVSYILSRESNSLSSRQFTGKGEDGPEHVSCETEILVYACVKISNLERFHSSYNMKQKIKISCWERKKVGISIVLAYKFKNSSLVAVKHSKDSPRWLNAATFFFFTEGSRKFMGASRIIESFFPWLALLHAKCKESRVLGRSSMMYIPT